MHLAPFPHPWRQGSAGPWVASTRCSTQGTRTAGCRRTQSMQALKREVIFNHQDLGIRDSGDQSGHGSCGDAKPCRMTAGSSRPSWRAYGTARPTRDLTYLQQTYSFHQENKIHTFLSLNTHTELNYLHSYNTSGKTSNNFSNLLEQINIEIYFKEFSGSKLPQRYGPASATEEPLHLKQARIWFIRTCVGTSKIQEV